MWAGSSKLWSLFGIPLQKAPLSFRKPEGDHTFYNRLRVQPNRLPVPCANTNFTLHLNPTPFELLESNPSRTQAFGVCHPPNYHASEWSTAWVWGVGFTMLYVWGFRVSERTVVACVRQLFFERSLSTTKIIREI